MGHIWLLAVFIPEAKPLTYIDPDFKLASSFFGQEKSAKREKEQEGRCSYFTQQII